MRTIKLIKNFEFKEENRKLITLGTNVRLVPGQHYVTLKATDSLYPTDSDLYVKTWVTNPKSVKQWLLFESVITHYFDSSGTQITGDGYRLSNGTDEYWWDGGAWVVNTINWNTEQEICNNISTFSVDSLKIQVIVNLFTTDSAYAPVLSEIKILYASDVQFKEDLIYKSLVPSLKENIRPIADYPVALAADSDTIDLNDYPLRTPYNIDNIDAVFNHTNDVNHLTDIFDSYDSNTQIITLTSVQSEGAVIWIQFTYEPEVAVTTKRTYSEIGKVPAIVISDYNGLASREGQHVGTVINKATGVGTKVLPPLQIDIEFVLRCLTDKARDQTRLTDEIKRYFRQNPVLKSSAMDESYRLWLLDEIDQQNVLGDSEIDPGRLRCIVSNTLFYQNGDEVAYAVKRFIINGPPNITVS